jgi:uncharacterized membrane-anchored protein YjiN (DUF445 family)
VDVCVSRGLSYLRAHREELMPQARAFVDDRGWLAAVLVSDRRIRRTLDGVADLLDEVDRDPRHPLRLWLEGLFRSVADQLQRDKQTAARFDAVVAQLLEDPQAQAALHDLLVDALASVRASLTDLEGDLPARLAGLVASLGQRVDEDEEFRERVLRVLQGVLGHAVENYGDEVTRLIRDQVARWDGASASRRIELAVGRDLQFIRINGTVVGALAGLALHALTQVVW